MSKEMFLKMNVIGMYSGRLFASKGDKVTVVSVHDNVSIVDNGKERFTVGNYQLSEDIIADEPQASPLPKSTEPPKRKIKSSKPQTITSKLFL
jgi:hypothetical protein